MEESKGFPKESYVFSLLLYLCGFLLFWEWLRPLEVISDTGNMTLLVLYAGFCFFLSMLKVSPWISAPLKIAGLVFILDGLFMQETIATRQWFIDFQIQLNYNIDRVMAREWTDLTPFFRSLLFLILLWLMSYLVYYWFIVARRVFLFILLTFIYITVIDTFTAYQADVAIVRTFIVAMFTLAISNFSKQMDKESLKPAYGKWFVSTVIPVLIILPLVTVLGYYAPKFEPKWPDPVPFITSTADYAGFGEGGNSVTQKVGYGEDDSNLGGSFIQDNTTVFEVDASRRHYWRIESKDRYTGKGWERSTDLIYESQPNGNVDLVMNTNEVATEELYASIRYTPAANFSKVVYPYGIEMIIGANGVDYLLNHETGIIEFEGPEQEGVTQEFDVMYKYPSFSLNQLESSGDNDPDQIKELYLQLPDSLPDRVKDLAANITAEDQNRYEKVKTVESYFGQNGFTYQSEDVAVPGRREDYVDQFLFDTQVGYCDNFSTSMVVMLRSLGIPARWVKGFTGGEIVTTDQVMSSYMNTYQVTNGNAHSWVEVYFSGIGWVPFEPTIGFSNNADFYQETDSDVDSSSDPDTEEEANTEEDKEEDESEQEQQDEDEQVLGSENKQGSIGLLNGYVLAAIILGLVIIAIVLFFTRYRLLTMLFINRYDKFNDEKSLDKAYHFLLRVLQHKGIKRKQGQTIREYGRQVDVFFGSNEMTQLTEYYERMIYRNDATLRDNEKVHELWEKLLRRAWS